MDEQVKASDARVNQPTEQTPFEIRSVEDYHALREKWRERTAIPKIIRARDAPAILSAAGLGEVRMLLNGDESRGGYMVGIMTLQPGEGAPPHHQPEEDEFFLVVDGELEVQIGQVTARLSRGDFAYAPRNTTHAFRAVGDGPVICFSINAPGGHERGFQLANRMLHEGRPLPEIMGVLRTYDFYFHGPKG